MKNHIRAFVVLVIVFFNMTQSICTGGFPRETLPADRSHFDENTGIDLSKGLVLDDDRVYPSEKSRTQKYRALNTKLIDAEKELDKEKIDKSWWRKLAIAACSIASVALIYIIWASVTDFMNRDTKKDKFGTWTS